MVAFTRKPSPQPGVPFQFPETDDIEPDNYAGRTTVSPTTVPKQKPPELDRLDEAARILGSLTYGEMIEFIEGIEAIKGNDGSLAKAIHQWATTRPNKTDRG